MKVLYFQQNSDWGACEEYFQILIEGVKRTHHDWSLFLLCPEPSLEQWRLAVGQWTEVMAAPYSLIGLFTQFRRVKADVLHINDPAVKALSAARLAGMPRVVVTYHTPSLSICYNWKGEFLWWFGRHTRNLHVIALSETNKRLLIDQYGFSEDHVRVIPHGLKPEKFVVQDDPKRVREELGVPQEVFVLICVARLAPQKAHEVLLEAFAKVISRRLEPIHLLLAGDGERRHWLKARTKALRLDSLVHFLGHRNDVPHLLHIADVFVLSSDFEGLPFAILEAMAMGKPVIATAVNGVRDSVIHEQTGLLVPPRDPEALAHALLWMLDHPKESQEMGFVGRKRFQQLYSEERMVVETETLYRTLL
ncbi:MAG: glycosyltransferase [Candidatus Latescibacteria bacterium]|nr:glycosyltransferase [Candidatus Latescibacterota bacterium]